MACKTSPEDFIESSRSDDQTDVLKITLPRMDITNILSKVKYKLSVIHWLINLTFSGSSLVNQSRVLLNVIFIFPEQRRKRGFREDIPEMRPGLSQCGVFQILDPIFHVYLFCDAYLIFIILNFCLFGTRSLHKKNLCREDVPTEGGCMRYFWVEY